MRAGQSGLTGSEGQIAVERQFVRLNWGVARNPTEHDLGTDLWLMARDIRRFDLGALIGAQVKTGPTSFNRPVTDDAGLITGWWYYDSGSDHFKYWVEHNVPHILVLHDLPTDTSYWIHVTADRVISTGQGSKIFVPENNRVDLDHLDALLEVALGKREPIQWEGSAWRGGQGIVGADRLRYALLTPRLIAPHRNLAVSEFGPEEAIAMLVKMQLTELQPSPSPYRESKAPNLLECSESPDWRWRFYAALYDSIVAEDGIDALRELSRDDAAATMEQAAAAAMSAALLMESKQPMDALAVIEPIIEADVCAPVDQAWLLTQQARCLADVGAVERAVEQAVLIQELRRTHPGDPTAMAIVGAAADMIFSLSNWGARPIADVVAGRDTLAAWWRTQEIAVGFEFKAEEDFKAWARDRSITWGRNDETWLRLRAASLIAGATGDHRAWRAATSQLAQHTLTTSEDNAKATHSGLSMLRVAGDTESVALAVPHIIDTGSIPAIVECCNQIDLNTSTRTTLRSDLEFIEQAADVLPTIEADAHTQWALGVLTDPTVLRDKLKPSFVIKDAVLDMIARLVPALSDSLLRSVINHVISVIPQGDQMAAHGYAKVVYRIPQEAWTTADIDVVRRRVGDNFELQEEFEIVVAAADESHRLSLEERIARGDWAAFEAFGDVRDLRPETVEPLVEQLSAAVSTEISRIRSGQSGRGGRSPAATLIIVNAWHPDHANWRPITELLGTTGGFTYHLKRPLQILYRLGSHVPTVVVDELVPTLRELMTSLPRTHILTGDPDVRGDAAAALESMRLGSVTQSDLWDLTLGSPEQRVGAAQVIAAGREIARLDALVAIAHDRDPSVRGAVANLLVGWLSAEPEHEPVKALLQRLVESSGMSVARSVAARLDGTGRNEQLDEVASLLRDHTSAVIRKRITRYFEGNPVDH
ncbi:DUF4365 domain-containing protein [Mycobacterium paragordonae]|uniref:DUF4365 domain-containing protein n=1 Tax=Mycobacterium paragordonae TaxID=1389713 RepID=UPI00105F6702|nr:DUF4365 domain-containing protein [Mycobacterium paragordonae]TDK88368.1 DUF4365 domain-containing protein [Mycobacterium paragordonae]